MSVLSEIRRAFAAQREWYTAALINKLKCDEDEFWSVVGRLISSRDLEGSTTVSRGERVFVLKASDGWPGNLKVKEQEERIAELEKEVAALRGERDDLRHKLSILELAGAYSKSVTPTHLPKYTSTLDRTV